jgi:plasmid stabilization system protein ParE
MKLVFSSVFEADLAEISTRLAAEASAEIAVRWENAVVGAVEQLQEWPELGRSRPELRPVGIRSWGIKQFPNYLLFYRVTGDELALLRVRYGGMNLPGLFPG